VIVLIDEYDVINLSVCMILLRPLKLGPSHGKLVILVSQYMAIPGFKMTL